VNRYASIGHPRRAGEPLGPYPDGGRVQQRGAAAAGVGPVAIETVGAGSAVGRPRASGPPAMRRQGELVDVE
jgi:hypothetical protein